MKSFLFLCHEGIKYLFKEKFSNIFSILIIAVSLTLIGLVYIAVRDSMQLINRIQSQFDLEIFLKPKTSSSDLEAIRTILEKSSEIEYFEYISPEEAAKQFQREFGENIFEILDFNPLPPSFTIKLRPEFKNQDTIVQISTQLIRHPAIDEIKYRQQTLNLIIRYKRLAIALALLIFIFFTFISLVLISNSIRLSILVQKQLIDTLKILGASERFIKTPLVIEGALQGFLGGILSALSIVMLAYINNKYLNPFIGYQVGSSFKFYFSLVLIGSLLGIWGAGRTEHKYLI
jgi:cell division transport system permease protein